MDRNAGRLAERHKPGDDVVGVTVFLDQRFAVIVRSDAAHIVVNRRHDRYRLAGQIDAGENARGLSNARQAFGEKLRVEVIEVKEDVVLLRPDTAAFANLDGHRA